uniref:Neuronal acetylcholine receptor subunit alpha-4-like n=1 Tax=Saccoglossus kowalevskii TaxID=10224 RepID=A0ABM0MAP2_SACKO|nr:PREDICTED: neuronal acetylcholine receptor subunit alpha-4-like [Saccoglossus kowalevskii]
MSLGFYSQVFVVPKGVSTHQPVPRRLVATQPKQVVVGRASKANTRFTTPVGLPSKFLVNQEKSNPHPTQQLVFLGMEAGLKWTDYRLEWNPANYSGVDTLIVSFQKLWYPDMVLYSSADGKYDLPLSKNVRLSSDGIIKVAPPAVLVSPCVINIKYFPFDVQRCSLKIGTWEYNGNETRLTPMHDEVVKENYLENVEWEIVGSEVDDLLVKYPCCPYIYSNLVYTLIVRRRPLYYITNIIIPCFFMSFITLSVFYLPPDSGEKITLSISILLALSVLNLLVADIMPPTSETTPLITKYLLFCMTIVMASIIITILVLNVHHRATSTHNMPMWVRKIFMQILPRYLHMKAARTPSHGRRKREKSEAEMSESHTCGEIKETGVDKSSGIWIGHGSSKLQKDKQPMDTSVTFLSNGGLKTSSRNHSSQVPLLSATQNKRRTARTSMSRPISCRCVQGEIYEKDTSVDAESVISEKDCSAYASNEDDRKNGMFHRKMLENVECIVDYVKRERNEYDVREEWKYVAMVIDRILLILFTVGFLIGSFVLMLIISGVMGVP